ncbi:response regulator transcription factor, partial [Campylobacter sp.]|uniref:response regulator transcription factor n=1 Tax=Campylobacter sp. TaxID=205 RepID=UPI0026F48777|nr:response regulator transcription factor [Campylobacter sp.]
MYSKIKEILKDVNLMIVEDDDDLREAIKSAIEQYVNEIYACKDAKEALECFSLHNINLIVSDINMPRMNGLKMASIIRKTDENVPILFLTAYDSDENMLSAIDVKSSGVLKKPFEKRELVMMMSFAANKFKSDFASVDLKKGFVFNAFTRELYKDGEVVALTKKEQALLHLFLKNQMRTVSFEMIEACVWPSESCTSDAIRAFVYKLRKKLYPELIQNAQGIGYKLCLNEECDRTVSEVGYV